MRLASKGEHRPGVVVARLYTRADCSLCDQAHRILTRLADEALLSLECIDIEDDPALSEQYDSRIPVVQLSSGIQFEGRISEYRMRKALERLSV